MNRMIAGVIFWGFVWMFSAGNQAAACVHYDDAYPYVLKEGTKYAFLFHDGTNAHLVVRTEVEAVEGKLPANLALVMPFPSLPSKYEEVSPEIFTDLGKIATPLEPRGSPVLGAPSPVRQGIIVHEKKIVGNYQIQPIEIRSKGAGNEFNDWLKAHHFNPMPIGLQKDYLRPGAVFLAIQMKLDGTQAQLKPLHITYRSEVLSFPMKFTHATRTYDLDLFILSKDRIEPKTASSYYLQWAGYGSGGDAGPALKALLGKTTGMITYFQGRSLNQPGKMLAKLPADPKFSP